MCNVHQAVYCRLVGLTLPAAYVLYAWGATRVVPAQRELEVQGTAYALIHRLEPLLDGILLRSPSTLAPVCRFIFTNQLDYLKYMMPLCEH